MSSHSLYNFMCSGYFISCLDSSLRKSRNRSSCHCEWCSGVSTVLLGTPTVCPEEHAKGFWNATLATLLCSKVILIIPRVPPARSYIVLENVGIVNHELQIKNEQILHLILGRRKENKIALILDTIISERMMRVFAIQPSSAVTGFISPSNEPVLLSSLLHR